MTDPTPTPEDIKAMQLLLQGCKRNDRDSQRLLYQHYYGYAMSIALRYCKTNEEAREVLNDGFLKVFTRIEQYNETTSFKGWLRRIIINSAIDHYRKENKHYHHSDVEDLELPTDAMSGDSELSYEELMAMIRRLPPSYQAVFNLHVIDGYTHEEIGLILDISEGTSKSNLAKARESLRRMLKKMSKVYAKYV